MKAKKRQPIACDVCRKSKKKCDGNSPCERCKLGNKVCTYTPLKRRKCFKKLTKTAVVPLMSDDSLLTGKAISRRFIETYFTHINPADYICECKIASFDEPTSKASFLQYNAILATSIRTTGNPQLYRSYEKRALQLAGDLIGDFSFETAFGFYLLAFHLWGEDDNLGIHYKDIAQSLCNRMLGMARKNGGKQDHFLRLLIALGSITHVCGNTWKDFDTVNTIIQTNLPYFGSNPDVVRIYTFKLKLFSVLLKDDDDPQFDSNPFKPISKIEYEQLSENLLQFEMFCNAAYKSRSSFFVDALAILSNFFKSMLYFEAGDVSSAIWYTRKCVEIIESNLPMIQYCTPVLISFSHFSFMIAFLQKDKQLANKISMYQGKLAEKLPCGRQILEKDVELLKLLDKEKNVDSFEYSPSPPPSNIFNFSNVSELPILTMPNLFDDNAPLYSEIEQILSGNM